MTLCLIWSLWLNIAPLLPAERCDLYTITNQAMFPALLMQKRDATEMDDPTLRTAQFKEFDEAIVHFHSPVSRLPAISSGFGMRKHPILGRMIHHNGIDISLPFGTPLKAVAAGKVISAGYDPLVGRYITLHHADGWYSRYMHLSEISVVRNRTVGVGETIGFSGNTGRSTGAHLHLEIGYRSVPLDPLMLMEPTNGNPFNELPRYAHDDVAVEVEEKISSPRIVLVTGEGRHIRISVVWNKRRSVVSPGAYVFGKYRVTRAPNGRYELVSVI